MVAKVETRLVTLTSIEWCDTDSQLRIDRSPEYVDSLAEILIEADEHARDTAKHIGGPVKFDHPFPEIVLFTDGGINSRFYIGDGYNRYHAHRKASRDAIRAKVHVVEEPRFEAFRYALSANAKHGRPRTNADKRNAVRQALACPRFAGMSNREIAKLCEVVHQTVANIIAEDTKPEVANLATPDEPARSVVVSDVEPQDRPSTRVSTPRDHESPRITDATIPIDPPAEAGPLDKLSREVPSGLLAKFEAGKKLAEWRRQANALAKEIEGCISKDGMLPGFEHFDIQSAFMHAKSVADDCGNGIYHTECPECDRGKVKGAKCKVCLGAGFLTASMYERLPPKSKEKLSA